VTQLDAAGQGLIKFDKVGQSSAYLEEIGAKKEAKVAQFGGAQSQLRSGQFAATFSQLSPHFCSPFCHATPFGPHLPVIWPTRSLRRADKQTDRQSRQTVSLAGTSGIPFVSCAVVFGAAK